MEIISPKTDFCAKELFANPVVRKYFISDVTGIALEEIRSVRLCNSFLWKKHKMQKQGILDVLIELNDDTKVNIELQVKFYSYWDKRNLFYLAQMYTEDLRMGQDYDRLKKCITISILDFNLTDSLEYHTVYSLRDKKGKLFTELFEVHIIELKKKLNGQEKLDDWIRFFNAKSEEELDMIHTENAGIHAAIQEVKTMSLRGRLRARYEAHLKEVRDKNAREDYVRKEGIAQGIEQGIAQGIEQGITQGIAQGENRVNRLNRLLAEQNRMEDIVRAAADEEYRKQLYEEFRL